MITPQVKNTAPQCLQFYYHMYGRNIGRLNIYIKTGNSLPINAVWTKALSQGNVWIKGQTTIQATQAYNVSSFI
jgi:hypothetical protein